MLSYTHAGLYYVYYVVAELLAFLDDIHIHGTDGVGIEMVVYIVDVLALQLIGEVCRFIIERLYSLAEENSKTITEESNNSSSEEKNPSEEKGRKSLLQPMNGNIAKIL